MRASRTFKYGAHDVTIETGNIARQADGAVMVNMADTVVLVTAVGASKDVEGRDFFPLTVNYQERSSCNTTLMKSSLFLSSNSSFS